jgi:CO/xanthine dehydrogenase FAD-binding subunit
MIPERRMGQYLRPATPEGALALLAERTRTVLAGGTDHFPARVMDGPDEDILDISALPGLREITRRGAHVVVPALATWSDLIAAPLPAAFDGLRAAARQIGGVQIQNAATVLGNVCNASPAADGIPCLLALDAAVELASVGGRRMLPLADFLRGPRQTARRADELALALHIPAPATPARSVFLKLGARRYLVISIAMVAAVAELTADGRIARARIAVGACSPVARLLPALAADLAGQFPDPALVRADHLDPLAPIDDVRATAAYRRAAALELVRRAVGALSAAEALAA